MDHDNLIKAALESLMEELAKDEYAGNRSGLLERLKQIWASKWGKADPIASKNPQSTQEAALARQKMGLLDNEAKGAKRAVVRPTVGQPTVKPPLNTQVNRKVAEGVALAHQQAGDKSDPYWVQQAAQTNPELTPKARPDSTAASDKLIYGPQSETDRAVAVKASSDRMARQKQATGALKTLSRIAQSPGSQWSQSQPQAAPAVQPKPLPKRNELRLNEKATTALEQLPKLLKHIANLVKT
jgi:hypothetical protein